MIKTVYIRSPIRLHSYLRTLAETPPDDYCFVLRKFVVSTTGGYRDIFIQNLINPALRRLMLPEKLLVASVSCLDIPPSRTRLTLTSGILNFRHEPWIPVLTDDALTSFIGYPYDVRSFHRLVENALGGEDCKAIVCFFEAAQKSLESTFDTSAFKSKIKHVPLGVPLIPKRSRRKNKTINILFIGSTNYTLRGSNDIWFYNRGGHIAIKAFLRLRKEFDNIAFTFRSQLPPSYLRILRQDPHACVIDRPLSHEEFDDLLWAADILLLPMRDSPWGSFLDAMNHELPIITTHTYANAEVVHDGKWGFVCEVPDALKPIVDGYYIPDKTTFHKLWNAWMDNDQVITNKIVEAARILIKDEDLRSQMGLAGRRMIEPGGLFSVNRRNNYLKRVLDKATD
jgi:glycosyltransferase involved in cell wall biosynthesis